MRRAATREDIIRTTQALIIRNGIRAVRVDEIAQTLGISKRTLYETFTDKTELVNTCLEDLHESQRRKVTECMGLPAATPLHKVASLVNFYINNLSSIELSLLEELETKELYSELLNEEMCFWSENIGNALILGQTEGYILEDVECLKIANQLLSALYKMRLADTLISEQLIFSRTILRGVSTQKGILQIDAHA